MHTWWFLCPESWVLASWHDARARRVLILSNTTSYSITTIIRRSKYAHNKIKLNLWQPPDPDVCHFRNNLAAESGGQWMFSITAWGSPSAKGVSPWPTRLRTPHRTAFAWPSARGFWGTFLRRRRPKLASRRQSSWRIPPSTLRRVRRSFISLKWGLGTKPLVMAMLYSISQGGVCGWGPRPGLGCWGFWDRTSSVFCPSVAK